jgi:hypothetical protein
MTLVATTIAGRRCATGQTAGTKTRVRRSFNLLRGALWAKGDS